MSGRMTSQETPENQQVDLSYGLVALVVLTDRTSRRQLAELVETIEHRAVLTNIN